MADQALTWRLVAEAADRCADGAFDLAVRCARTTDEMGIAEQATRMRMLGELVCDLMTDQAT
jgi:hypothetical protein